jgi:Virulence-associated protein E-like domain
VVYGIHPDTGTHYDWSWCCLGFSPLQCRLDELPLVTPEQLLEFAHETAALLEQLGYGKATVSFAGGYGKCAASQASVGKRVSWQNLRRRLSYIHPEFDGARPACYPPLRSHKNALPYGPEAWLGIGLCLRDGDVPLLDADEHDWFELIEQWSDGTLWFERTGERLTITTFPEQGIEARLGGSKRQGGALTTIATIIAYAADGGCPLPPDDEPFGASVGSNDAIVKVSTTSVAALELSRGEVVTWPRMTKEGKPTKHPLNTEKLLDVLRVTVFKDVFAGLTYRESVDDTNEMDDETMRDLHQKAIRLGLNISKDAFVETVLDLAAKDKRHPVKSYLDGLKWDGVERLDTWLTLYGGAEDIPYTRAVGRLILVAAVRRVREPGCKFDPMLVLEGPQGNEKSSALRALAGNNWFTDALTLGAESKVMIEQTRGKWIVEIPELGGMTQKDVETIKAQLSRQSDRARPAYARVTSEVPRQFILIGTNNPEIGVGYLKDTTGNRRFLPVAVKGFNVGALTRDRDQLWAEAAQVEKTHGDLVLPRELWPVAAHVQEERRQKDPLESKLTEALEGLAGFLPTDEIYELLGMGTASHGNNITKRRPSHDKVIARVMRDCGWVKERRCPAGQRNVRRGYGKAPYDSWLVYDGGGGFVSRPMASDVVAAAGLDGAAATFDFGGSSEKP